MAAGSDRFVTVFGGTGFLGRRIVRHLRLHGFCGVPNRQFAFAAHSDIERLRAGIGTDARNMDEPFNSGSLRLNCDPLGRLDMDGMKRLRSVLDVKANCVHRAVSISKRLGN